MWRPTPQVAYGTTAAYGSTTPLNSAFTTSHSVNLTGLLPSTTYHYQVLSSDSQGNLATSSDFTFTTGSPSSLPLLLQLHLDASEVSGTTNGSVVTPAVAPTGLTGEVVVNGNGSVNFAPAQNGNGVYFLNCCTDFNNAYYKFTGAAVGSLFNVNQGQISFYLKSQLSFAQRQTGLSRQVFDVRDANPANHVFGFGSYATASYLAFQYQVGGTLYRYYVPQGSEDTLFGIGAVLNVSIAWDSTGVRLYLNGNLVQSSAPSVISGNWTALSVFDLGA